MACPHPHPTPEAEKPHHNDRPMPMRTYSYVHANHQHGHRYANTNLKEENGGRDYGCDVLVGMGYLYGTLHSTYHPLCPSTKV